MFVEGGAGEVGVALEHVDDDGPPGDEVALLGFVVQLGVGTDDVGAETTRISTLWRS